MDKLHWTYESNDKCHVCYGHLSFDYMIRDKSKTVRIQRLHFDVGKDKVCIPCFAVAFQQLLIDKKGYVKTTFNEDVFPMFLRQSVYNQPIYHDLMELWMTHRLFVAANELHSFNSRIPQEIMEIYFNERRMWLDITDKVAKLCDGKHPCGPNGLHMYTEVLKNSTIIEWPGTHAEDRFMWMSAVPKEDEIDLVDDLALTIITQTRLMFSDDEQPC